MKRQVLPMMAALGCLAGLFTSSCFTQIPSGEQSSKLDASVSGDMATRRNCAGFEAYPGTELACWNFQDEATRNDALRWAMVGTRHPISAPTNPMFVGMARRTTLCGGTYRMVIESVSFVLTELTKGIHVRSSTAAVDVFVNYRSVVLGALRYRAEWRPPFLSLLQS